MQLRLGLMIFSSMGALGCAVVGINEYELASRSSTVPEEIALADLIRRGPAGNPNILLADFDICDDFIYQTRRRSKHWSKVWGPIVPSTQGDTIGDQSAAVQAFLYSDAVGNEQEVYDRLDRAKLHGMVDATVEKPGIKSSKMIK